jgi:DUF4097 and DUF4098 domain-containing protein YvlB
MKSFALRAAGAAVAAAALAIVPASGQSRNHNIHVDFNDQTASCADLHARSDGALAQAVDRFTVAGSSIQIDGGSRGAIRVTAADRADYSVEACRFAVADDQGTAQRLVDQTSVTQGAGRIETHGPVSSDNQSQWQVYLIVQAPRNGSVDLNTVNGPLSVRGVNGSVKAKAVNGPVSIADCAGTVDAQTTNGPVSFSGQGGDVKLAAVNGPVSVKLLGDTWNGPRLEASTTNGPVSLSAPDSFRSGVTLESNGGAPFSCKADMCRYAVTDAASEHRTLQLNGTAGTVHVSAGNGPVSVRGLAR